MWTPVGYFRCVACDEVKRVSARARRSPYRRRFGVCVSCFESWERKGRLCVRCWGPVNQGLDLAFLSDKRAFGHVACGGALLV